ncbi:AraC family transcriptional regulator [Nocardia panacis]|uniref:AraC family transcriptional regulator n=1 Tax=Nocardia panacis TaxID=2340916 RepID=A0A3A4KC01_9NOCA|nr:helix-turn-helix domain-containing protein [Nocardia panacis]RJO75793.1 AraC family transcriptional regulator [Nocardia panacis]
MEPVAQRVSAPPAPNLADFIDGYIGYRQYGFAPGLHRGLPSRHLTFIVSIGAPIDVVAQTNPRQPPEGYRCVVSGLQATHATIAHPGHQEGVVVALSPLGCRTLFGLPAGELWDTSVECAELTGAIGRQLWEELQGTIDWPTRFGVCDRILSTLAGPGRVALELTHAWRSIVDSDGAMPIGPLADEIGWSRQHLTRRFTAEFGLSPKLAARVARFERAKRMIERIPSYITLAEVAAVCGYYDQAHLNRDFVELAGCAPTTWLAGEVPSVQDEHRLPG